MSDNQPKHPDETPLSTFGMPFYVEVMNDVHADLLKQRPVEDDQFQHYSYQRLIMMASDLLRAANRAYRIKATFSIDPDTLEPGQNFYADFDGLRWWFEYLGHNRAWVVHPSMAEHKWRDSIDISELSRISLRYGVYDASETP